MNQTRASQGSFYPGVLARVEEYGENGETYPTPTRVWHKATFNGEERTFAVYEAAVRWPEEKQEELRVKKWFAAHPEIGAANAAARAELEEEA